MFALTLSTLHSLLQQPRQRLRVAFGQSLRPVLHDVLIVAVLPEIVVGTLGYVPAGKREEHTNSACARLTNDIICVY